MKFEWPKSMFVIASVLSILSIFGGVIFWTARTVEILRKQDEAVEIRIDHLQSNNMELKKMQDKMYEIYQRLGIIEAKLHLILEGRIEENQCIETEGLLHAVEQ